jgi:small subunit ribosomal protein S1
MDISAEASREMEAMMAAATADTGGHAVEAAKPKIRGPRKVEGGREYRKGVVVSVGPEAVFIEFGPKELGILDRAHLRENPVPTVGSQLEVVVDRFDPNESLYLCSLPGAVQKADWEMLEKGQVVEAKVTGVNKGGLELEVVGHRAFMPASQVDIHRIEDLSVFIGQKLPCKVTRVDRSGRGNITLSRRDVLAEERKQAVATLKEKLAVGDEIAGVVRAIMPFGAFIDMGGADGLLHVSDLSHDRAGKIEDKLKVGDSVRVKVLSLDWENGRHSLGLKQLEPDPWETSAAEIREQEIVTGRVTKLTDFGCFIEIAPGVEGLCHISELDWKRVNKVSDSVQPNATVQAKVLKVDRGTRKIGLSIKQAKERPFDPKAKAREEEHSKRIEEITKETPEFRRLREKALLKQKPGAAAEKSDKRLGQGGLGSAGGMGMGLGDLKL